VFISSIAEHGLLQSLAVSQAKGPMAPQDVHDGARLCSAIRLLIERANLAKEHPFDPSNTPNDAEARRSG